ncbi:peptidoglycan-binding protein [Streptomyces sp. TLI_146]|uniref:peptidoglycan-binding domain-containing protein n=2 Tax=Streptomyces TaxID=1883 RepID=UPI000CC8F2AE|nr:peptidoglycan-binding domain-containing protein [Streptomyces sp. TLI_146]PKV83051.1 putative peptidoglycan binding protein [Streptomyces sp. TLI_146]
MVWALVWAVALAVGCAVLVVAPCTGTVRPEWPAWTRDTATSAPCPYRGGYYTGTARLRRGCIGDAVREVQALLLQCGYPVTCVDGVFGPPLETLVKAFQTDQGLRADGAVGPATWERLRHC